jgi:hypothetical protein
LSAAAQAGAAGFAGAAISTGTFKGALQGAFSAFVFYGIGQTFESGVVNGTVKNGLQFGTSIGAHAVAGCVMGVASGAKCGPSALSSAFSKLATPFTGGLHPIPGAFVSAIIGGTASELGGGKFANGAMTGAFSYLFNEFASRNRSNVYGPLGSTVYAVESGVVTRIGWENPNDQGAGFGFRIYIQSVDSASTWIYAHMDPSIGDRVYEGLLISKGEEIGRYGKPANGNTSGPHLHLELRDARGRPIEQPAVEPIPGGRMTSPQNPNRTVCTNNGCKTSPHNGTDWVERR